MRAGRDVSVRVGLRAVSNRSAVLESRRAAVTSAAARGGTNPHPPRFPYQIINIALLALPTSIREDTLVHALWVPLSQHCGCNGSKALGYRLRGQRKGPGEQLVSVIVVLSLEAASGGGAIWASDALAERELGWGARSLISRHYLTEPDRGRERKGGGCGPQFKIQISGIVGGRGSPPPHQRTAAAASRVPRTSDRTEPAANRYVNMEFTLMEQRLNVSKHCKSHGNSSCRFIEKRAGI
ncbi:unnamed protein product, partial [Iphiclides podalirius]